MFHPVTVPQSADQSAIIPGFHCVAAMRAIRDKRDRELEAIAPHERYHYLAEQLKKYHGAELASN